MINNTKIKFFFFLFLFCFCLFSNAQKLNIKNYSVEDGLPQSQILDIGHDHSGLLCLATNGGGVSSFDGIKFTNYTSKDGLNSNHAYTTFEDKSKTIWIGTSKGLNKIIKNTLYKITDSAISNLNIYFITQ